MPSVSKAVSRRCVMAWRMHGGKTSPVRRRYVVRLTPNIFRTAAESDTACLLFDTMLHVETTLTGAI